MSGFTKGPWVSTHRGLVAWQHGYVADCRNRTIAKEAVEANAHLIASAPAMYEALEAAMGFIDKHQRLFEEGEYNAIQDQLAHALNQARGV